MANDKKSNDNNDLIFEQELESLFQELEKNGDIDKYEAENEKTSKDEKINMKK